MKNKDYIPERAMNLKADRREFLRQTGLLGLGMAAWGSPANGSSSVDRNLEPAFPKQAAPSQYAQQISKPVEHWNVFDATCVIGRHLKLQENGLYSAEDLLAEMDHYGIAEALVLDSLSRENHPEDGNARILEVTDKHPRLHRAWAALPTGVQGRPTQSQQTFVAEMRRHHVSALFLLPNQYFFKLSDWCIDELIEPMAAEGVPVFINPIEVSGRSGGQSDATDWDAIVALCRRWPKLSVVVSESRIRRSQRQVYKALDACPNLHIELSAYWLHRGIEYITERWGAERLIFGSGWPTYGQHMTLATLTTAEISETDKRLIAGDNLRHLLKWCKLEHPAVTLSQPEDEFVKFGRTGLRPNEMTFYDAHGHLGEHNAHYHVPNSTENGIIADMNRLGVVKTCVMSFAGVYSDEVYGNDIVASAIKHNPERFVGFTMLNPLRGRDEMVRELERGAAMGMRGVKLIATYQGYPREGALIDVACEWANQHKQIIINHDWGTAEQMKRLLTKYPNACFITAHTTTAYADIMKQHANLFVCSVPLLVPRACEEVVQAIGADRLLFGTDLMDLPIAWNLGPIIFARISPDEKRLILGGNLQRILKSYSLPQVSSK